MFAWDPQAGGSTADGLEQQELCHLNWQISILKPLAEPCGRISGSNQAHGEWTDHRYRQDNTLLSLCTLCAKHEATTSSQLTQLRTLETRRNSQPWRSCPKVTKSAYNQLPSNTSKLHLLSKKWSVTTICKMVIYHFSHFGFRTVKHPRYILWISKLQSCFVIFELFPPLPFF